MARTWYRCAVGCLSAVLTVWALLPLVSRVVNVGVFLPAAVGAAGMWWGFASPYRNRKGGRRVVTVVMITVVCMVIGLSGVMIGLMAGAATRRPDDAEPTTVVVLGAGVRDDATPSRMLRDRLDSAIGYLQSHPQAVCIVTGGQGSDEPCTEASVMAHYLQQHGIDPARIRLEERATSTHENMQYSMQMIRDEGLPTNVVIATQEFHQYRAARMAYAAGAGEVSALTSASPPHLLLCYWVRECAAICRMWIIGY